MYKKFLLTKFFSALQRSSQKGISIDAQVFQNSYDEFVTLVFSENAVLTDRAAFHNTLIYTRVELASFTEVSGKK